MVVASKGGRMQSRFCVVCSLSIVILIGCGAETPRHSGHKPSYMSPIVQHAERDRTAVLAIYMTRGARTPVSADLPIHSLIFALFDDREAVRSMDRLEGGAPYERGYLSAGQFNELIAQLETLLMGKEDFTSFGPNSSWHTIAFQPNEEESPLHLRSWHELYESPGLVVASEEGLVFLEGRTEREVMAKWSAAYSQFRGVWKQIRDAVEEVDLIELKVTDDSGTVFDGG